MAGSLGLDDKLLGEKTHYYCSSSEDEGENEDDSDASASEGEGEASGSAARQAAKEPTFIPEPELPKYNGHCTQTGPKGVLNDWRRFKQLESEKRDEQERERVQLLNKLSLTCRSEMDDEKEKQKDAQFMEEMDKELEEFEDEFLREYRKKRIEEMRKTLENVPKFGRLLSLLTSEQFIQAIDKEKPIVTVVVHIYDEQVAACRTMNGCLECLAQEYPTVKFCKIQASQARLSVNFAVNGVPALLIYKKGELIGNFIRLSDEFGQDFYATDIEGFLVEHGMLPDKTLATSIIRKSTVAQREDDSGSDFEVD